MKTILTILSLVLLASCDVLFEPGTDDRDNLYAMTESEIRDLSSIFGDTFISRYIDKIYVADLSGHNDADGTAGAAAVYKPINDTITIDSGVPAANYRYILAHEFTHAWQHKRAPVSRSVYEFSDNTTTRQGKESEACMVQVYMHLKHASSYSYHGSKYTQTDRTWMRTYFKKFLFLVVQ